MSHRHRRAEREVAETLEMKLEGVDRGSRTDAGYDPLTLRTSRGTIESRYYPAAPASEAVIYVGGVGGGFDTPVRGGLYPRLCSRFQQEGISGLRVAYRHSTALLEATLDVLAGVAFLEREGIRKVGLVGWSLGGAAVVQAASLSERVRTVVTIATQSYGIEPARELGPRCSILLLHGKADQTMPIHCSEFGFEIAREPKELLLHEYANHGLDQWGDEVVDLIHDWLRDQLRRPSDRRQ
ncbi:MAG: alpha/beta hydrolase family protein [Phycisphaeraceae bacterium]